MRGPSALLQRLHSLYDASEGRLEILVSSRAEVDVQQWFPECALVNVNESTPPAEIETYLTMEIKKPDKKLRLFQGTREDLEDELIEALRARTNGMYVSYCL